jgi:tetratricopeptide (TPR) repeat protein
MFTRSIHQRFIVSLSLDNCIRLVLQAVIIAVLGFTGCSRKGELLDRAQTSWDKGDFAGAAEKYEEFLKNNPHHEQAADARLRVANTYYYNLKSYEKAIPHYIRLIEDFPKSPDASAARQRLAECYVELGKRQEAINEYEGLLSTSGDEVDRRRIRLNIADLYYDLNDLGQALAEYEKVRDPATYDQLTERALLRVAGIRVLRDEFEEALAAYSEVVKNSKDRAMIRQARLGVADCYARTFEYDQAVRTLEQTEPETTSPDDLKHRIAAIREEQRQRNFSMTQTNRP